jgi:hypothetical protein
MKLWLKMRPFKVLPTVVLNCNKYVKTSVTEADVFPLLTQP